MEISFNFHFNFLISYPYWLFQEEQQSGIDRQILGWGTKNKKRRNSESELLDWK